MSAGNAPSTSTQQTSQQTTVQGGAGTTTTGSQVGNTQLSTTTGNVVQNDPSLQLGTVQALANVVQQALGGTANLANNASATVAQVGAQNSSNSSDLLSQVLADEQNLAAYQGTNGGIQSSQTTTYLIWAGLGIAALAVLAFLFRHK